MLDWALAYAKNERRPVFPCYEIEVAKGDCTRHRNCDGHGAKSPRTDHGHKDASTDARQLADWSRQMARAHDDCDQSHKLELARKEGDARK